MGANDCFSKLINTNYHNCFLTVPWTDEESVQKQINQLLGPGLSTVYNCPVAVTLQFHLKVSRPCARCVVEITPLLHSAACGGVFFSCNILVMVSSST